jgi:hypothetical protein
MASIARVLARIKQELHKLVPQDVIEEACRSIQYKYRNRKLDPLTTIHLFAQQVLNANAAVTELPRLSGLDFDGGSYCDARKRLPLKLLQMVVRKVAEALRDEMSTQGLWEGHHTWLVDGTGVSMPDTPDLQKAFGQPGNQKVGCGFPVAHLLAMFDVYSGMLMETLAFPLRTHDLSQVMGLHPRLGANDVLVGDRGFCSFAHLAILNSCGILGLFRAHQKTIIQFRDKPEPHRNITPAQGESRSRLIGRLGFEDQLVEWYKPETKPAWMSQEQYAKLPESMVVRELRYRVPCKGKGCRVKSVTLVTTLLDDRKYTKAKLAKLYKLRWRVEQNLRDLKITLKMDVLKCKTETGVRKELAMYALVYNLICAVRSEGARRQKVRPERLSFVDVTRWLREAEVGDPIPRFVVNPLREGRREPRAVKRRPKQYYRLTEPRSQYKERVGKRRNERNLARAKA